MPQEFSNSKRKGDFMNKENAPVQISLMAIMAALVTVGTLIIRIPNPMGGYFNVGDVMIFVCALTFNPIISGLAGGSTLIIKGLEGFLASLITNKKNAFRDVLAVIVAGSEMIIGYFLVELYALQWGLGLALAEVPGNSGKHRSNRHRRTCRNSHSLRFAKKTARNFETLKPDFQDCACIRSIWKRDTAAYSSLNRLFCKGHPKMVTNWPNQFDFFSCSRNHFSS